MILRQRGGSRLALSLSTVAVEEDIADYANSQGMIAAQAKTKEYHLNKVYLPA